MKTLVTFWSGTGNTEKMAECIAQGIGAADITHIGSISEDKMLEYDKIAFGCPSMGAEVLEEDEFEPKFAAIENQLNGKKVALFGSYGWGDGEWMRDWEQRVKDNGVQLFDGEGLIINETPDDEDCEKCTTFGKDFAAF